jgi:hypothetical protein
MSFPDWTFADVMEQVNAFLSNDVISGLVVAVIALGLVPRIVSTIRKLVGW